MPKDNNITNNQDQNAATNQEAASQHNNIPGDDIRDTDEVTTSKRNKEKGTKEAEEKLNGKKDNGK